MNHNKKRNTAFLYEVLLREGTKSTIQKNVSTAKIVKNLIFEHFNKNTEMYKELYLYKSLQSNTVEEEIAEKYLKEVENRHNRINKTKLFNEQTKLINKINKTLGQGVFSNFIPNYKDLASISQLFNPSTKIKEKILLEESIINTIKTKKISDNNLQPIDNLVLKTFSKKFNEKYSGLLHEQKELLTKYINSLSNSNLEFKIYLNEELDRLKEVVKNSLNVEEIKSDERMIQKTQSTLDFLNKFKDVKEISNDMLEKILKVQEFVGEVTKQC